MNKEDNRFYRENAWRDHNEHFHQVINQGTGLPLGVQTAATYIHDFPTDWELSSAQNLRMSCLQMANLHATPQQIADGQVYKIADDYYDYIINGKK
jgi:hypothetical protein